MNKLAAVTISLTLLGLSGLAYSAPPVGVGPPMNKAPGGLPGPIPPPPHGFPAPPAPAPAPAVSVPEISAAGAVLGFALAGGLVLVMRERRRRHNQG